MGWPRCPDFSAFIASLTRHHVRSVVVGAHALAALGQARMTDDLDVLVEPTPENARRVADALRSLGGFSRLAEPGAGILAEPDRLVSIGRAPVSTDILTSLPGVRFADAWRGRDEHEVDGVKIAFLGLREMVCTRRAAGRLKDRLDLTLLAEAGLIDDGDVDPRDQG